MIPPLVEITSVSGGLFIQDFLVKKGYVILKHTL